MACIKGPPMLGHFAKSNAGWTLYVNLGFRFFKVHGWGLGFRVPRFKLGV